MGQQSLPGFEEIKPKPAAAKKAAKTEPAKEAFEFPLPEPLENFDSLKGRTVYVIDAHALIYQVFHAMPPISSPSGQPVGAVHGFTRDIIELIARRKPDLLFCAFDHSAVTFRHEFYPKYKSTRKAMPDDLRPQIGDIRRMVAAMNIPVVDLPNYEADDILATLAREVEERGGECVLVTTDKDCRQLISDRVTMLNIRKNQFYDAKSLMKDWGIRPDQVVDFQALTGDSTDDVPGVALIGPKIAKELLEKYDTLENVLDNASELSGKKRRENLMNGREVAELSRRLVRLDQNCPVELDWPGSVVGPFPREKALELCNEFGFRRLTDRIMQWNLAVESAPPPDDWVTEYHIIDSLEALSEIVAEMQQQPRVSLDTETTSTMPRFAEIVGYSFCWEFGKAFYVPVSSPDGEPQLDPAAALEILRPFFENADVKKVGQNLKYEKIVLRAAGVELRGVEFDTMVADYLLDPGQRNHSLDDLSHRYLHHQTIKIKEIIGVGKKQILMNEAPVEQVAEYAAEDAEVPWRLYEQLHERLEKEGLATLFSTLEIPLIEVLAEMEFNGIRIDIERLAELSKKHGERIASLETDIYEIAGKEFNIDSRQQLGEILFEDFGLPVIKKTKTGPSTDVEVLTQLADQHELPAKIVEYRQSAKLKSTYVDALPEQLHPETQRIHTSFMQDVAATGRLSSKDPNLQNIPIRTEEGREIRSAFVAPADDWRLLTADYSQIELRVLAHFSGDETLLQAFADGEDIHTRVASEVYEVAVADVSPEMRRSAKAINFGIIYGQSAFGLAKSLDISRDQASEFIDAYFERYPGVEQFMEDVLENALQKGSVETIEGRRRLVEGVRPPKKRSSRSRNLPERIAINTVIQGSAADLIKRAMLQVHSALQSSDLKTKLLLQIHDELVFEFPLEEQAALTELVQTQMTNVGQLKTPLVVDVKVGSDWASCE